MALQSPEPGNYYEADQECRDGALVVFRVHEHCPPKQIVSKKTGRVSDVSPVRCDILVLTGSRAKLVVRNDEVIGKGITSSLRRVSPGNDGVFRMAFGEYEGRPYPQANAIDMNGPDGAFVRDVFEKTNGDPYAAAERAAAPTAGLQSPPADEAAPAQASPASSAPQLGEAPWAGQVPAQQPAAPAAQQPVAAGVW